jgi:hypothetical protein
MVDRREDYVCITCGNWDWAGKCKCKEDMKLKKFEYK